VSLLTRFLWNGRGKVQLVIAEGQQQSPSRVYFKSYLRDKEKKKNPQYANTAVTSIKIRARRLQKEMQWLTRQKLKFFLLSLLQTPLRWKAFGKMLSKQA